MKRVLKWLGGFLLIVVLIPLLVLIAFVANNLFDEKPDPEAEAFAARGAPRAASVPEAQNGFMAYLALGASDGEDGLAYAKAWLAETRAAGRENREFKQIPVKRAKRPVPCNSIETSCLTLVRDKAAEMAPVLDAWKEDLPRYERLLASTAYEQIRDSFGADELASAINSQVQHAYLLRAAMAVQEGRMGDALADLEKDIALQRARIECARNLIGNRVAASAYASDLAFLTDLMQVHAEGIKPHAQRIVSMLRPLPPVAPTLELFMAVDYAFGRWTATRPGVLPDFFEGGFPAGWLAWKLYKPAKNNNYVYRKGYAMELQRLQKSPAELAAMTRAGIPRDGDWEEIKRFFNNPAGEWTLAVFKMDYALDFGLRLHDLEAHNRLVGLAAEVLAAGTPLEGVGGFVAKAEARYHDPYTGKPMEWDAAKRRLSFKNGSKYFGKDRYYHEKGVTFVAL